MSFFLTSDLDLDLDPDPSKKKTFNKNSTHPRRRVQNHVSSNVIHRLGQQRARGHAHAEAQQVQHWPSNHTRQNSRHHQVIGRVSTQNPERVRLLADGHGSQLGRERRSYPPRHDDCRDDWCELSRKRQAQHSPNGARESHAGKLADELDGENHPDKGRGEKRDAERARPDEQELVYRVLPVDFPPRDAPEGLASQDEATGGALEPARRAEGVEEAEQGFLVLRVGFLREREMSLK